MSHAGFQGAAHGVRFVSIFTSCQENFLKYKPLSRSTHMDHATSIVIPHIHDGLETVPDPAEQVPLVARSVTPPSPPTSPSEMMERGDDQGTTLLQQRAPRSCTVFVMTPPNEHTSEGGRDDRGVPYHAESTLSSAQVLKTRAAGAARRVRL